KGALVDTSRKRARLERRYGQGHLHFITCSCYRRRALLRTARRRNAFLRILDEVRTRYQFSLVGYVVMPEHIHLLISEPKKGTPTTVMQVLKQRVSRALRGKQRGRRNPNQLPLWRDLPSDAPKSFWQRRIYDFNVWSGKKKIEKLNYMHMNPVKRGLAADPKLWVWSSYGFYQHGERNSCAPNPEPG
ncbi:MAG: REP-associated tyrosine transposase, partial [Candidatus Acidiferrales bacterium]